MNKIFVFSVFVFLAGIIGFSQLSYASGAESSNINFQRTMYAKQKLAIHNSHQAGQVAKRKFGGKVLKVSKLNKKGRTSYFVRVLKSNGKVLSVVVDATTGRVSKR